MKAAILLASLVALVAASPFADSGEPGVDYSVGKTKDLHIKEGEVNEGDGRKVYLTEEGRRAASEGRKESQERYSSSSKTVTKTKTVVKMKSNAVDTSKEHEHMLDATLKITFDKYSEYEGMRTFDVAIRVREWKSKDVMGDEVAKHGITLLSAEYQRADKIEIVQQDGGVDARCWFFNEDITRPIVKEATQYKGYSFDRKAAKTDANIKMIYCENARETCSKH